MHRQKFKAYRTEVCAKIFFEKLSIFHTVEKPLPAVDNWRHHNWTNAD